MNERIRELAEHAHSYACEYAQQPDYNPHNPYNQSMYKQRYDSKFAELMLNDIDGIIDNLYHAMPYGMSLEQAAVLLALEKQIKQHFGVEE